MSFINEEQRDHSRETVTNQRESMDTGDGAPCGCCLYTELERRPFTGYRVYAREAFKHDSALDHRGDVMVFVVRHRSREQIRRLVEGCPFLSGMYFHYESEHVDAKTDLSLCMSATLRKQCAGSFVTNVLAISVRQESGDDLTFREAVFTYFQREVDEIFSDLIPREGLNAWLEAVFLPYRRSCRSVFRLDTPFSRRLAGEEARLGEAAHWNGIDWNIIDGYILR